MYFYKVYVIIFQKEKMYVYMLSRKNYKLTEPVEDGQHPRPLYRCLPRWRA